jgi:23S rRNA (guanosine2251-2'-O)-methyltransferase
MILKIMKQGRKDRSSDLIYGIHAVWEAMQAEKRAVLSLLVVRSHRSRRLEEILDAAGRRGIPVSLLDGSEMSRRCPGREDQGVAARVEPYPYGSLDDALASKGPRLLLALDEVQDPQNLGALIRSAVAFGAGALILPRSRSASVTPAVVRASAGMTERLTVVLVPNLATALRTVQERGVWVFGLDGRADRSLYMEDLTQDLMFVMGSEGKGLRRLTAELCDGLLRIPLSPGCESLNVAAAAAVGLAEAARQRRTRSGDS